MRAVLLPAILPAFLSGLALTTLAAAAQEPITGALSQHALFSRLALTDAGDTGPNLRLLVEPPRRPSEAHHGKVEALFAPWLAALDRTIVASYVTPNTLERRESPELGVIVLANVPTLRNAERYQTRVDHLSPKCLVIDDPGVVVALWNERMERVPADEVRRPVLDRVARELLARYHRGAGDRPGERWVLDGVAGYLAAPGVDATPDDLAHPPPDAGALERTLAWLAEPATEGLLLPLAAFVEASEDGPREQVAGSLAREAGARLDRDGALQLFRDQAALWVHYLERGEGGRHTAGWRRYVAKVLHDNGGAAELAASLGTTTDDLELGFRRHLEELAGGGGAAGGPVVVDEGAVLHEGLAAVAADADAVVADALGRAAIGDLDAALAHAEAGLRALGGADRGRVAAERDRLRAVRDTRDAFLASLPGGRRRLRWTDAAGESVSAPVEAIEDGVLVLGKNKARRERFPVDEIGADDLARSMGNDAEEHGPAWVPHYLGLLAGDERWDRKMDTDTPEAAALAAAAELPALAREGRRRARLARLARTPLPERAPEAAPLLAEVAALAAEAGSPAVDAARPGLRTLAATLLAAEWRATPLDRRLHGKVSRERGDRVEIVYDFDDPAEMADFAPVEGYLADRAASLRGVSSEEPGWAVRGGNLEGEGAVALRHLVALQAPIVVEYELLHGRARPGAEPNSTFLMAICDDGKGGYVGAWDVFDLDAIDPTTGFVRRAEHTGERLMAPARTYDVRLEHAGPTAILTVDGEERQKVMAGRRTSGATLLWLHADGVVAIRRLSIRGRLAADDGDDPAREAWIAARLAELGL